jgi:hypothetical protein
MGRLYYGNSTESIVMPDRVLAHLKIVTSTKLRRSESFTVSFPQPGNPEGRSTIWLHCSIPLRFEQDRADIGIDRRYLEELAQAAASSGGVVLDYSEVELETTDAEREAAPVALASDLRRVA